MLTRPGAAPLEGAVSSHSFASPRPRQRSKTTTPTSKASDSSTPLLSRELIDKLARRTFAAEDTFEMSRYDEAMDRELAELDSLLLNAQKVADNARADLSMCLNPFQAQNAYYAAVDRLKAAQAAPDDNDMELLQLMVEQCKKDYLSAGQAIETAKEKVKVALNKNKTNPFSKLLELNIK